MVQKENEIKKEMDKKYVAQNANRLKLKNNIYEANENLNMSKKKIKQGTFLMEHSKDGSHTSKKKGPDAGRTPVDVDKMLTDIRKKIVEIHKREIGQTEVSGKATITLLNVSYTFKSYNLTLFS